MAIDIREADPPRPLRPRTGHEAALSADARLGRLEGQMDIMVQALRELRLEVRAVNTRIDRMFIATWAIGGGIIATLIGLTATLA